MLINLVIFAKAYPVWYNARQCSVNVVFHNSLRIDDFHLSAPHSAGGLTPPRIETRVRSKPIERRCG